jgi:hypothetical protein
MTRMDLEQRVSNGLLRDGVLGRFLLIPNDGRRAWMSTPPAWTVADTHAQDSLCRDLRAIAGATDVLGNVFNRFTPEAREARDAWYMQTGGRLEAEANEGGDVELALSDAFGRLQTVAVKVAAVVAVSEMMEGDRMSDIQIQPRHVEYGHRLAEFCMAEIRSLATAGHGTAHDRLAQRIVTYLGKRNGHGPASRKELLDACAADGLTRDQKWSVVESLYKDGTVHIERVETGGRPRQEVSLT